MICWVGRAVLVSVTLPINLKLKVFIQVELQQVWDIQMSFGRHKNNIPILLLFYFIYVAVFNYGF